MFIIYRPSRMFRKNTFLLLNIDIYKENHALILDANDGQDITEILDR